VEAIRNLAVQRLNYILSNGQMTALGAHDEIERIPTSQNKAAPFFRHFLPLRNALVALLAGSYRSYFKVALAHPREVGRDPDKWAWAQLQPLIATVLEWIRNWHILACDGANQSQPFPVGTFEAVPGQTVSVPLPLTAPLFPPPESWRAPAWLFQIGSFVGIGPLKDKHVPRTDSEEKLSTAHTRLLLKGARRVFLWELGAAIKTVRNEEIAAAGAIPGEREGGQSAEAKKQKHWSKGTKGLVQKKADLSRYMQGLTEKQQLAASLNWEYGLGLTEIASRMGIDRKTAAGHIDAATRKIPQVLSSEKRKGQRAKNTSE